VAWKDTREARRALADSLPILKCAEQVLVMAISSRDEAESTRVHVSAVLDYLLDHGIEARSRVVAANEAEAAPLIQAEARAIDADLIVAGAYGRTRLGEWLFGGVTLGLLSEPERFLLISH
jgi:nucleotide-binding universal stress UspA family protein